MRWIVVPGLAIYCLIAAWGPFIRLELFSPWVIPWVIGYLFLLFRVSFEAYVAPPPIRPFPFVVLGIILLNFLVQVTGGVHSLLWPAYFIFAVVVSALLPPRLAYAMVGIILAVESSNLLLTLGWQEPAARWHVYAGFGLSLAAVSVAASHIMQRTRSEAEQARDAHERLIAHADAYDPLSKSVPAGPPTAEQKHAATVHAARQREISFNGIIDMIYGFVPAHTYAIFLKELNRGTGDAVYVLRAVRTKDEEAVLPVGTVVDPQTNAIVRSCAELRQPQNLSDLSSLSIPLSNLGYYRPEARSIPVRSFLMLPIEDQNEVMGVLAVDSLEPGAFSSMEVVDLIEKFAPFIVQTSKHIQTSLELDREASRFKFLHGLSTDLNASLKLGEIMNSVLPRIKGEVDFDYCACLLMNERNGVHTMTLSALSGYPPELAETEFNIKDSSIIDQMYRAWTERAVTAFYSSDLRDRGKDIGLFPLKEMQLPIRTLYGRLLVAKGKVVGAFFIASLAPNAFTEYHRKLLLETILNQLSMVAYNALLYQQIEDTARTDGLTGLLNHRTFMEKLQEKCKELERRPRPFSILLMDIDKFKSVNDKYGHPVGDQAIKAVARVLRSTVRGSDFAARYGGEEFAVGMVDTDSKGAEQMAERVRKNMEGTMVTRVHDGELRVTLSIGVASYPDDTGDPENLVTSADEALYHAKRSGRNRVCLSSEAKRAQTTAHS